MSMLARTCVAAALAAVLATGACDDEPSRPDGGPTGPDGEAAALAERLRDLPGVGDAEAGREEVEDGVTGTVVGVDLEADVEPEELVAVLEEVTAAAPEQWAVHLDAGSTDPFGSEDHDRVVGTAADAGDLDSRAQRFLATARAFPDATVVDAAEETSVLVGPDPTAVTAVVGQLAADAPDDLVDVTVAAIDRTDDVSRTVAAFSTTGAPVASDDVTTWEALLATYDAAPDIAVSGTVLDVDRTGGAPVVRLASTVALPGVVRPEDLTPQRYGDRLWPLIHAQLDLVATLPHGSSYSFANDYRSAPDAAPTGTDPLIDLEVGGPPVDDPLGRDWTSDAADYLDGLR